MFYTKYRPQKFSEISRPNEAADALAKQVSTQKTAHAYLFVGPRGTGKTSTARILAKALNCTDLDKNGDPCDECNSCVAIKRGSYMDLIEIDAASNRGIDDIRELKNKVKLAPTAGKYKIYIIDEVHMLTTEAFNALLKTLEEPPKNTTFILCTTELHKVPDTIKSRCQVFKFKRATIKQLVTKLETIVEDEALTIEKSDLERIARASMGGFRDAETMLQQIAEGEVTVESLLNVTSREKYMEFCDLLLARSAPEALKQVNKVFDEGADIFVWVGEFVKHLRDLMMLKAGAPVEMFEIPDELLTQVKKQAQAVDADWLLATLELFLDAQPKIKNSFIPQLPVEIVIVKVCGSSGEGRGDKVVGPSEGPVAAPKAPTMKDTKVAAAAPKEIKSSVPNKKTAPVQEVVVEEVIVSEEPVVPEVTASASKGVHFDLAHVETMWSHVMERVDKINKSIVSLLKIGKPIALEGNFIILQVNYLFHKERLEAPHNRKVVESVLKDIFETTMGIKCVVSADRPKPLNPQEIGVLTDFNVVVPSKEAVLDMLDGGLPL